MHKLCQNGIDFDNCENAVESSGEFCNECCEKQYENFLESYYGGSTPMTSKERQEQAAKEKSKLR